MHPESFVSISLRAAEIQRIQGGRGGNYFDDDDEDDDDDDGDDDDDVDDEDVVVFVEGHHGGQGSRKTIIEELPDEFLHSLMVKF